MSKRTGLSIRILVGMALLVIYSKTVISAEPDWSSSPVSMQAQEQPLSDFLTGFFSEQNIKVVLSKKIKGNISGRFSAPPAKIFDDVTKAYGLLPYYDGYAMHIGTTQEAHSRSITIDKNKINNIIAEVAQQDLLNSHQSMQVITKQGLIKVRGAKQFVHDAEALIHKLAGNTPKQLSQPKKKRVATGATQKNQLIFRTFSLKYASAADVSYYQNGQPVLIPGVATLLSNMVGDGRSLSGTTINIGYPGKQSLPGLRGQGLRRYGANDTAGNTGIYASDSSQMQADLSANATRRESMVRIQAERNLNAVIVRDYADAMPLYESLIKQLDKEPQLVEIQVTIIDIDKNELKDIGFDWRYEGNRNSARFGGGDGIDEFGENGGLLFNTVIGDPRKLFAKVRALAEKGSAKVVSRPQVLTLNNLEAVLRNDQSFYVRIAGNNEVDLFNVSVGTSLRVVPHVVGDESDPKIRLLVTIEDGVIVPGASVDDIPIVERSSLSTQAIIFNGENLLLGGLVRDSTSNNVSKVPLLGDIPGVGNLFKRTENTETRTERLFLISPQIVGRSRSQRQTDTPENSMPGKLVATEKLTPVTYKSEVTPAAPERVVWPEYDDRSK